MKTNKFSTKFKSFVLTALIFISTLTFTSFDDTDFEIAKNLDIYYSMFRELQQFYVDEIDPGKLVKTSIDEMLKSLDPYTVFYPESEIEDYKFMTTGQYGGIGALIHKQNDKIIISEIYENFPADKAGLKAGDILIEVQGKTSADKSIDDISKLLKGQAGTQVTLKIMRKGANQPIEKQLIRENIAIESVPYFGVIENNIGYICLAQFTADCAKEMKNALIELKENKKVEALIIDLRGNPGGLLMESVDIVNLFVEQGEEVVSTRGKVESRNRVYRASNMAYDKNIPIVVLVSRTSASAAEIVSGALQDLDRAVVVGQRTFGKGLVQVTRPLTYNSQMKLTTSKYYIPSGRCIQALDYSHRNDDGSVGKVPDSLISEFKTRNGRKVFDGGGVLPDIEINNEPIGEISINLIRQNIIFDFVTDFVLSTDSILKPKDFILTEEHFSNFKKYLKEKQFTYKNRSEEVFEKLKETAIKEKYYDLSVAEFTELQNKITHSLESDLKIYRAEIEELLREEIVSRYYYQRGRIESALYHDAEIRKAIEILNSKEKYNQILLKK